jgi:hypothetical protein
MSTTCQLGLTKPVVQRANPQIRRINEVARMQICPQQDFSSLINVWNRFILKKFKLKGKKKDDRGLSHMGGRSIEHTLERKGGHVWRQRGTADLANLGSVTGYKLVITVKASRIYVALK